MQVPRVGLAEKDALLNQQFDAPNCLCPPTDRQSAEPFLDFGSQLDAPLPCAILFSHLPPAGHAAAAHPQVLDLHLLAVLTWPPCTGFAASIATR